jgi:hypothetical protein
MSKIDFTRITALRLIKEDNPVNNRKTILLDYAKISPGIVVVSYKPEPSTILNYKTYMHETRCLIAVDGQIKTSVIIESYFSPTKDS